MGFDFGGDVLFGVLKVGLLNGWKIGLGGYFVGVGWYCFDCGVYCCIDGFVR